MAWRIHQEDGPGRSPLRPRPSRNPAYFEGTPDFSPGPVSHPRARLRCMRTLFSTARCLARRCRRSRRMGGRRRRSISPGRSSRTAQASHCGRAPCSTAAQQVWLGLEASFHFSSRSAGRDGQPDMSLTRRQAPSFPRRRATRLRCNRRSLRPRERRDTGRKPYPRFRRIPPRRPPARRRRPLP